ncbi:hypothetical protein [Flavobacterium hydatis]|uniref:NACHT domain-containing protein n=1 Tax=Flavobacterium hydatis TaxID=991 RepID=A0A086A460_FLAHY|nr:hypothetical protein [Flavobacterium hydatis]KFF11474.1 hypothetical protein IW20_19500 [Flavobacterium hydatis]OXA93675.1 hypothetical protein B0A62_13065 [Flavobacterium hydatis]
MTENILMNEEEIRGKLLLPYLENLGFNTSEIVLEKSFSIRLGKTQRTTGLGKTNVMCSLALQNLVDKFVFFYNAALLTKSPLEHITQDLNGIFSSRNESDVVLKKLDNLGRFLNRDILIFIDAIDESADPNFSLELSEMALAARNLDKIKICISCKTSIWKSFLIPGDIKTHLYEELIKYHSPISTVQNCPAFLLEDFSNDEIKNVLPLYKNVFEFKGHISEKLHKELKNGFFLRIFSEEYSGRQVPEKINDRELIINMIDLDKIEDHPAFMKLFYHLLNENSFKPNLLKININDFDDWDYEYKLYED